MVDAHALIIGIANYQQINSLPTTVLDDARDIQALLIDPKLGGYSPANVHLLLDKQATLDGLRNGLSELARRSTAQSTVFIYLSSHGGRIESGVSAGEYILPVDTQYATEAALAASALSGAELTRALNAITARKVLVAFDCCHSGGIGQPKDAMGGAVVKAGLPTSYYTALQAGTGRVILASSRDTELSWVLPGAKNSLFTEHLLAGLRGGVPSPDGLVRIFDLFEYIQPRVTRDQPNQHPIFKAELEENFAIALSLGGQKSPAPTTEDGFLYDAYISYVDREPDATWVWETLVPMLEAANLRVAVSGDVEEPGVARVVSIERGIRQAKRTVAVLSEAYLADHLTTFVDVLAQAMGIHEGTYRLLPVQIADMDVGRLPARISQLVIPNLAHPRRAEREAQRLIQALQQPLPRV